MKFKKIVLDERNGKLGIQTVNYKIKPTDILNSGKTLVPTTDETISIVPNHNSSPANKKPKPSPQCQQLTASIDKSDPTEIEITQHNNNHTQDSLLEECLSLMPSVIAELDKHNTSTTFHNFLKLVTQNKFPLGNIAFILL